MVQDTRLLRGKRQLGNFLLYGREKRSEAVLHRAPDELFRHVVVVVTVDVAEPMMRARATSDGGRATTEGVYGRLRKQSQGSA